MSTAPEQPRREFVDRAEAGRVLAHLLGGYALRDDTLVLAVPRGGVPVAFEVAVALHAPLDVYVVRKLQIARYPELALGACAADGSYVLNHDVIRRLAISPHEVTEALSTEREQLTEQLRAYRADRPIPALLGATVILVDDGLATGATMRAAVAAVRAQAPARVVVAVPVASPEALIEIGEIADEVASVHAPARFRSVGTWYRNFPQVSDAEVRSLIEGAAALLKLSAPA